MTAVTDMVVLDRHLAAEASTAGDGVHSDDGRPQSHAVDARRPATHGTVWRTPAEPLPVVNPEVLVQDALITVAGNVGAMPRTRVVASGSVVTDFRIAYTPRKVDKATGAWADLPTIWFGVSCWRATAENVAASVKTGDRVVVSGRLRAHTWKTEQGEERSGLEIDAQSVGFDLSRGKAVQERTVPLSVTSDPGYRAADEPEDVADDRDREPDDDEVSLGDTVEAAA